MNALGTCQHAWTLLVWVVTKGCSDTSTVPAVATYEDDFPEIIAEGADAQSPEMETAEVVTMRSRLLRAIGRLCFTPSPDSFVYPGERRALVEHLLPEMYWPKPRPSESNTRSE